MYNKQDYLVYARLFKATEETDPLSRDVKFGCK